MKPPELRTVLIDDEAPAREMLHNLLSAYPHVRVIGEANSVANAIRLCEDLRPNLIFLDVQLGDGEGFDVLPRLSRVPAVIFVTAYSEYAFRAFEVNAIHYLLKPTEPALLANALERITYQPPQTGTGPFRRDDLMHLQTKGGRLFVLVSQISSIEADGNYSIVHLAKGGTHMIRRPMSEWEKILPNDLFCRPSRSFILNIELIRQINATGRDDTEVIVEGCPKPLPLGRDPAMQLRRILERSPLL